MKKIFFLVITLIIFSQCMKVNKPSSQGNDDKEKTIEKVIQSLKQKYGEAASFRIERGVKQAASLWKETDGNLKEFETFCQQYFIGNEADLEQVFTIFSRNTEIMNGSFNHITLRIQEPVQLDLGAIHPVDQIFAAYNPAAHVSEDFFINRLGFIAVLNFPFYSLKEKLELGKNWSRQEWAYARMGDAFTSRVPANLLQNYSNANAGADLYISEYNILAGYLVNANGDTLFSHDKKLLSHWNLRDEIKSSYADKEKGLEKQRMIYEVMKRIISQEIPKDVINSTQYQWNPFSNKVFKDGKDVKLAGEPDTRYLHIINQFKALKAIDAYNPELNTYIKRKFEGEMEIAQEDVEKLFSGFCSSPQVKKVAELISSRLGRNLEPFDIWYDGFKTRSLIPEEKLSAKTRQLYPDVAAFQKALPDILKKLGFTADKASFICSHVNVDAARGSGHAWGAAMKEQNSHLRTRIAPDGMDYKGYNIAIHEFGHNVEQTISLHDVDYFMLSGVPNTSFTEALAFLFQKRDLDLLGYNEQNENIKYMQTLDNFWSTYEIMGVSLVDMKVWKWLYEHPGANEAELKQAVLSIAGEVWNDYYASIFGVKDQTILAIYSHMISYPLYLSAYAFGQVIEFQIEQYISGKDFAGEVQRIFKIGRIVPDVWMKEAVGEPVSIRPMLEAADMAVEKLKK